ncbi:cell division protein FtsK [bacterium]|nr:MAG: cell division protein FtsK [bacterium]
MARRKSQRSRVLDVVITTFLSLFLFFVCLSVSGGLSGPEPMGMFGGWLGRQLQGLLGPWLLWVAPALPWLWVPAVRARNRRVAAQRLAWITGSFLTLSTFLGQSQLSLVGVPAGAGGWIGESIAGLMAGVIGSLGSFLFLATLVSWIVLRQLPPLRLELPALDGVTSALASIFGPLAAALAWARDWTLDTFDLIGERIDAARRAWLDERDERRVTVAADEEAEAEEEGEEEYEYEEGEEELAEGEEWEEESDEEDEGEEDADWEEEDEAEEGQPLAPPPEPRVVEMASAPAPSWARTDDDSAEFRLSRDPQELVSEDDELAVKPVRRRRGDYLLPSIDLLEDFKKEERGFTREALQMNARLLMDTLANFGIEGQINEIRPGPVVTTFEFEPAPGVKVSQIVSRSDDLALAMRATRIRIEAPIPGKAAVGIEIPNPYPQVVGLRQVIGAISSSGAEAPLEMAFGKSTEGDPFCADLSETPHLLVAGATGSGKSVCVNAIICNLLLRNGPDRVRLLMIDPKMLELSVYNGIPHLMHPVITDPREALKAVKFMVAEMETRYSRLARHGVRNIKDFNAKVLAGKAIDEKTREKITEPLSYCVFVIDELADLMMQLGNDLEMPIARLAQMSRAVGIHLVLATQRPSVNVITGVIKANFPSRIGFRVISKIDSRTILDAGGAEQLLGKGDMLFLMAGRSQPVRVHGAYLSMEECERIAAHWIDQVEGEPARLDLESSSSGSSSSDFGEDILLEDAREMVIATQMGSTTMIQRRLRVGYTRAARLMDMLEADNVVGPFEGSKARKVLIAKEEQEASG